MSDHKKYEFTAFQLWSLVSGVIGFIASIIGIIQAISVNGDVVQSSSPLLVITNTSINFGKIKIGFIDIVTSGLLYTLIFLPIGAFNLSEKVGRYTLGFVNPFLVLAWGLTFFKGNWLIISMTTTISLLWILLAAEILIDNGRGEIQRTFVLLLVFIPTLSLILVGFGSWRSDLAWTYSVLLNGLIAIIFLKNL